MKHSDRNKIIASNIKAYLKENSLTQKELANSIGISPSTMSDYMNLRSNPSQRVIQKMADFLGILKSDIDTTYREENDLATIYNRLENLRKKKVYSYVELQLEEQQKQKITNLRNDLAEESQVLSLQSKVSAGKGTLDLDPDHIDQVSYKGKLPKYFDLAFKVEGESMKPMFEDGEIIFVEKMVYPINGAIMVVQIDDEAFIKKIYIEESRLRLVSLNPKYKDIYANEENDIRIVGKVVS